MSPGSGLIAPVPHSRVGIAQSTLFEKMLVHCDVAPCNYGRPWNTFSP